MLRHGQSAQHRRNRRHRRGQLASWPVIVVALLSAPVASFAQPGGAELLPSQAVVSLQEAVQIAKRDRPGRVVRAVTVDVGGGRRMHEIRILLDEGGRVVTVRVDAQTGRVR